MVRARDMPVGGARRTGLAFAPVRFCRVACGTGTCGERLRSARPEDRFAARQCGVLALPCSHFCY
jgi:hypothetical protein